MVGRWKEPARWTDHPSNGPAGAAVVLGGVPRPRLPNEAELARLGAAIEALADTAPPPRSVLDWWRATWTHPSRVVAVGAALVLTVSMVGTAVALWRASAQDSRMLPDVVPLPLHVASVRRSTPAAAVTSRSLPLPDQRPPAKRLRHPKPAAPPAAPLASESLLREAALIDGARAVLGSDPARALALLEQHRREAPDGQLSPEREFLSVAALCRLGRVEEASRRVTELERRHPSSTYAARALRLVQKTRGANPLGDDGHNP